MLLVSGVKGSLELNGLTRLLVSGAVVSEACGLRAGVKPFGDPTVSNPSCETKRQQIADI